MTKTMSFLRPPLLVVAAAGLLSGCGTFFGPTGYFRDRGDDYLKAQTIEPITIPGDMTASNVGQLFVIPPVRDTGVASQQEFEVPRPASSDAMKEQRNEVKIQKLGDRSWISVNSSPDAVWPRVKGFLADRGLGVAVQDPVAGVIETTWLAQKQDDSTRDRYRMELMEGLRLHTTEIHVRQITLPAAAAANTRSVDWPSQSSMVNRESWMVRELSAHLAKEDTAQASMLAQSIGSGAQRVEHVSGADPCLRLRVDYARAWASVGGALNHDGFHVESSHREQGQFVASYSAGRQQVDEQSAEGGDSDSVASRFARIFDFSGSSKADAPDDLKTYTVLMQQRESLVEVRVRDASGQMLPLKDVEALLRRIRINLL